LIFFKRCEEVKLAIEPLTGGTITGQQSGQTGLFAVCYQLSRRGWNVLPTSRNARGVDNGHANVVFAQSDSAFYGMNREWWRGEATIADGALTITGFRVFRYAFDGPDRLYVTATLKSGGVTSEHWPVPT